MSRLKEKFLGFENEKNNCWLDASLSLIVYNETFNKIVSRYPKSQINYIITKHKEAISILNDSDKKIEDKISETKAVLVKIQQNTLQYLQHFSNFKEGEPDSAFCALYNLILQDKSNIKEQVIANWSWSKKCANCGNSSKYEPLMKPIITLPKVKSFNPECPTSFYTCSSCKTEQEMMLTYKLLPPCLIFHFENGAGDEKDHPVTFTVENREYHLTAVVILEKSGDPNLNHFVTYIREPSLNFWLDCNDLNTNIVTFSYLKPEFALKDVCMYVFEAFDDLGKITNEVSTDTDQNVENLHVEFIDLANEVEEIKPSFENSDKKNYTSKLFQGEKVVPFLSSEEKLDDWLIKGESKAENKAVSIIDQPLKVIKEKQSNVNNCMVPVISKISDTPDISSNMTPIGGTFSVKKVENKESSCNLFGGKNINAYDESLTEISVNKSSSQNFEKRNISPISLSSKADSHIISPKPANDRNLKPVNSNVRRCKSNRYLSPDALEFIKAKKRENLEKAALSSGGSVNNEQECMSDCKSEKNSKISSLKRKLDDVDTPARSFTDNNQTKARDEQKDSISTVVVGKSAIDMCNQQTSTEKSKKVVLIHSSNHLHDEIKPSSPKVARCNEESANKHSNMLSQRSAAESESDVCKYDEEELLLKMQQTKLKVKKFKGTACSSNESETAGTSKGSSNNDAMKSATRKSSRISSKRKKIKPNKIHEPEEDLPPCPHGLGCTDRVLCHKVQKVMGNIVERTFASLLEQIFLRQDKYM